MLKSNEIESKYFNLLEDEISIKEFENWVYNSKWLENELSEDEYTDLISLNFNTSSSIYEIGKILKERLDEGRFETIRMLNLLNSIIDRDGREAKALTKMYDLYCQGYYFLEDLGLGIGLQISITNKVEVEDSRESTNSQNDKLLESAYPIAKELAEELSSWLKVGDLKLTGEKEPELSRWLYIDKRKEIDRKSRVWEISDIDKETGEIRSKRNKLLDGNGEFQSESKLDGS